MIALDDEALAASHPAVLDHAFIGQHVDGFKHFAQTARACAWEHLTRRSGLTRIAMEAAAMAYARANNVIGIYGMGLTQHRAGVEAVQMLVNLLLLRGNIGKPGAGICPVRGHSNVQGQPTIGITEKPKLVTCSIDTGIATIRREGLQQVCVMGFERSIINRRYQLRCYRPLVPWIAWPTNTTLTHRGTKE